MKWFVEIVAFDGDKVDRRMEFSTERSAETADAGVNRNLNHDDYYTRIVSEDG